MRKKNKHHLIPKSRRNDYKTKKVHETSRVLKLWEDKHNMWHYLFKNMTLDEIIVTLNRIRKIKFGKELNLRPNENY